MDSRVPLEPDTILRLPLGDGGPVSFRILREIGRGASCIVYDAQYTASAGVLKSVRIRECFPWRLQITRREDGSLEPAEEDRPAFQAALERMRKDFQVSSSLFRTGILSDALVNTLDLCGSGGTLYLVSVFSPEETLAARQPETLKDCMTLTRLIALSLGEIHRAGYLYLDLKPDNVLLVQGPAQRVLLFDFDSLISLSDLHSRIPSGQMRLSCSSGFSPLEQRLGQRRRMGVQTDVYSLGALLFWLVSGRTPEAPDCRSDARLDPEQLKFDLTPCAPALKPALEEFFHHTLASSPRDRCGSMEEAAAALENLERLADPKVPFARGIPVVPPAMLIGREREMEALRQWAADSTRPCLWVTGMGGIGKSSLARSFAASCGSLFDEVLLLRCSATLSETLADDTSLFLSTVEKVSGETAEEYARRKLRTLRRITGDRHLLLILDGWQPAPGEDPLSLLSPGWKLLILSRSRPEGTPGAVLELKSLTDRQDRRALFQLHLGRNLTPEETADADRLTDCAAGHPLALELTARQTAVSCLTVKEAADLAARHGFARMTADRISGEPDSGTVADYLSALFDAGRLPQSRRTLLRILSLLDESGIEGRQLKSLMNLPSLDDVTALVSEGWCQREGTRISLHPVIAETVRVRPWTELSRIAVRRLFDALASEIRAIHPIVEQAAPDTPALAELLRISLSCISRVQEDRALASSDECLDLTFSAAMALPRWREAEILDLCSRLLARADRLPQMKVLTVYNRQEEVFCCRDDLDSGLEVLKQMKAFIGPRAGAEARGRYLDTKVLWLDTKLAGDYTPEDRDKKKLIREMISTGEEAVRCLEKGSSPVLLCYALLSAAVLRIRCGIPGLRGTVERYLRRAEKLLQQFPDPSGDLLLSCHMVRAWYSLLISRDRLAVSEALGRARSAADSMDMTPLDRIDNFLIPSADIRLSCGEEFPPAADLEEGIALCAEHPDVEPYVRKQYELLNCLMDVYTIFSDRNPARETRRRMEQHKALAQEAGIELPEVHTLDWDYEHMGDL